MPLFENEKYLDELKNRSKQSRIYKMHQSIGLEVAALLEDPSHKALYMKLAKKHGADKILQLAKTVAEKKDIKNKGAYFMKVIHNAKR